jgi:hypothetical protein
MTKLIVDLRKFAKVLKKFEVQEYCNMCRMDNEIVGLWLVILCCRTWESKLRVCELILVGFVLP